ncbi:MAG: DUF167 family protein [Rugosibacter sp.]|jgi:uncharacterized protein (TIGR00251 family)|nr:DUF167 family protein [Rugosibacter sp.]MDO9272372.1 DUF167 family protein [Rugosibacter sp.]
MSWLQMDEAGVTLTLYIQPGAKKTEVVGLHGEALKIRLHAPPVEGQANAQLIAFLALHLAVPKRGVTLLSGETSRAKKVRVMGVEARHVRARLIPA